MSELKPCAHCGESKAYIDTFYPNDVEIWRVICGECGFGTGACLSAGEAVEDWNRRASPWVKMSDRKPDEGQEVFVKIKDADYLYSRAEYFNGAFVGVHFLEGESWLNLIESQVTHWMPIPPLGEENDQKSTD